ncbi:hypothetical protein BGX24_005576, partial [Mortierella sp. AD032]
DLHTDIKKIKDKFFAPGSDITNFLDAFVRGEGGLPVTNGAIRGLPRAWRRAFGKPDETRPSLLFLDLPTLQGLIQPHGISHQAVAKLVP